MKRIFKATDRHAPGQVVLELSIAEHDAILEAVRYMSGCLPSGLEKYKAYRRFDAGYVITSGIEWEKLFI